MGSLCPGFAEASRTLFLLWRVIVVSPMHTRNQLTKRAVVNKMVRDGRAHRIHYEDPLMSTRSRPSGPLDGWSEQGWLGRNLEFLWRDTTLLKREQEATKSWMSV